MSHEIERRLIESRFQAAMPPNHPIQFGNTPFTPPATGFVRLTLLGGAGASLLALTGGAQRRHPGVIDVALFVPRDGGTRALRETADLVEAALAYQDLQEDTVRLVTFGAGFTELGPAGDWYQGNVSIRYQRDTA